MPAALLGCLFSVYAPAESGPYRNATLVEHTSDFSVSSWKPVTARDLSNHGELVTLSPQNRGVLLFADAQYPQYRVGDDARRRRSFTVTSGTQSYRVKPFRAGFASAAFLRD